MLADSRFHPNCAVHVVLRQVMRHLYKDHRRILLVDENSRKLNLRAGILRNHEVEVHTANGLVEAASFWRNIAYDLVLLALPENSNEAVVATEQIRRSKPRQRVGLLVGPPAYIQEIGRPKKQQTSQLPDVPVAALKDMVPAPQWKAMVQKVVGDWYTEQGWLDPGEMS